MNIEEQKSEIWKKVAEWRAQGAEYLTGTLVHLAKCPKCGASVKDIDSWNGTVELDKDSPGDPPVFWNFRLCLYQCDSCSTRYYAHDEWRVAVAGEHCYPID
jgi:hypothetical protein